MSNETANKSDLSFYIKSNELNATLSAQKKSANKLWKMANDPIYTECARVQLESAWKEQCRAMFDTEMALRELIKNEGI